MDNPENCKRIENQKTRNTNMMLLGERENITKSEKSIIEAGKEETSDPKNDGWLFTMVRKGVMGAATKREKTGEDKRGQDKEKV